MVPFWQKRSSNISLGTYHFVSDKDIYKGVKNSSYDRNRKDRDQFQMKNKTNRKKAAQRKTERQSKFVFQKNESEIKSRKRDCGQCFTVEENISLSPLMEKKTECQKKHLVQFSPSSIWKLDVPLYCSSQNMWCRWQCCPLFMQTFRYSNYTVIGVRQPKAGPDRKRPADMDVHYNLVDRIIPIAEKCFDTFLNLSCNQTWFYLT